MCYDLNSVEIKLVAIGKAIDTATTVTITGSADGTVVAGDFIIPPSTVATDLVNSDGN